MSKNKIIKIIFIILVTVLVLFAFMNIAPKCIFLSPLCYTDNKNLSQHENYFIKKIVLEAVEERFSSFADASSHIDETTATNLEVIQLDKNVKNRKHVFIFINSDFMDSVTKTDSGYSVRVQTHFMETVSDDCIYEIHLSSSDNGYMVTYFGLDP